MTDTSWEQTAYLICDRLGIERKADTLHIVEAIERLRSGVDWSDIEDVIWGAIQDSIDVDWTPNIAAKAVVEALKKEPGFGAGGVKVKELEWDSEGYAEVASLGGHYRVRHHEGRKSWHVSLVGLPNYLWAYFDTEAEAKAAAQADYEQRILSALSVAPPPPVSEPLCEDEGCEHFGTPHICVDCPPVLRAGGPDGWQLVPKEPTDDMYRAALSVTRDDGYGHCHDVVGGAVYRAMLSVAPPPPVSGAGEDAARSIAKMVLEWFTGPNPRDEDALSRIIQKRLDRFATTPESINAEMLEAARSLLDDHHITFTVRAVRLRALIAKATAGKAAEKKAAEAAKDRATISNSEEL